jgi:hypothetical protein
MAKIAIAIGGLLIALGVVCFIQTGATHYTALIPAVVGVLLELTGVLTLMLPNARMHTMHAAATVGLLGFIAAIGGLIARRPVGIALVEMLLLLGLSGLFVVLCVFSFIAARRARIGGV